MWFCRRLDSLSYFSAYFFFTQNNDALYGDWLFLIFSLAGFLCFSSCGDLFCRPYFIQCIWDSIYFFFDRMVHKPLGGTPSDSSDLNIDWTLSTVCVVGSLIFSVPVHPSIDIFQAASNTWKLKKDFRFNISRMFLYSILSFQQSKRLLRVPLSFQKQFVSLLILTASFK